MSAGTLLYSETGRVVPGMCEEITAYRRVRKILHAPVTPAGDSTLFLHVRRYAAHDFPLLVTVNGAAFAYPALPAQEHLHWAELRLPQGVIRAGENVIELATDALSQTGWSISIEDGHDAPQSFISADRGLTWQNRRMGIYHVERGEYLIRIRTGSVETTSPAPFVWEDSGNPRLQEFRDLIPAEVRSLAEPWARARALASWVSAEWPYCNAADGATIYTPWDPFTILAWTPGKRIHGQTGAPIRMCMHYGIVFVCACLACGIPARGIIATRDIRKLQGHFAAEVWDERFDQWSLVDPNLDLVMEDDGRPLGAAEVFGYSKPLGGLVRTGPSTKLHHPRLTGYIEEYGREAVMLRHVAVWPRNDFFSHPEMAPACHGQEAYSETEMIWCDRNDARQELGMFPHIAPEEWFRRPPPAEWRPSISRLVSAES